MNTLYLRYVLSFFIILGITRGINCNASKITIRHKAKYVGFNIKSFHRKVFSNTPVWSIVSGSNESLIFDYEGDIKLNGSMYEDLKKKAILFKAKNCNKNWALLVPINASAFSNNYNIPSMRLRSLSDDRVETFYAKLLIVVDHVLFKKLGSNVEYVKKYMSVFWSAVDLQYRNISSPNIEIRITGILIGKDNKTLSYIDKYSPDGNSVNIERVLHSSRGIKNIIINNTNLTNFDAIVTMTGFPGFMLGWNKVVRLASNGIAWNGTICVDEYNFAVIMDDGAYYGVHNAIHEVGHLFGLDHDGYPGNGLFCFPRDYHTLPVMYRSFEVRDLEYWSTCSLNSLKIFTSNETQSWCLKSEYHEQKLGAII